ncbi:MAG: hypothetical protein KKG59_01625 [Nanoarchaeota archaeon]|nr:hypothetical protein [Nanoarchaeota archaeon]
MGKISKDTPLAEITLRKYEPPGVQGRELVRKLCLSLGLLQPGDSRDVIVDVFQIILEEKTELSAKQIEEKVIVNRKKHNLQLLGIASSNIRRQILRLRDIFLIEKIQNNYRLNENQKLSVIFSEQIESYYLNSILKRVKDYIKEVEKM